MSSAVRREAQKLKPVGRLFWRILDQLRPIWFRPDWSIPKCLEKKRKVRLIKQMKCQPWLVVMPSTHCICYNLWHVTVCFPSVLSGFNLNQLPEDCLTHCYSRCQPKSIKSNLRTYVLYPIWQYSYQSLFNATLVKKCKSRPSTIFIEDTSLSLVNIVIYCQDKR